MMQRCLNIRINGNTCQENNKAANDPAMRDHWLRIPLCLALGDSVTRRNEVGIKRLSYVLRGSISPQS